MTLISLLGTAWPELGSLPNKEHRQRISSSPNYDSKTQRFVNRRQIEFDHQMDNFDYKALSKQQLIGKEKRSPKSKLPQQRPNLKAFEASTKLTYHWLGHSTVLLKIDGKTILIDPVFHNAAPVPFAVPRFQKPVLPLPELPEVNVILISHDHYDHLDRRSIRHFRNTSTQFVVPLGVSSYLIGWGIEAERITELDWWQEHNVLGLTIACTPSQHFSGRTGPRGNKTLWASYAVVGTEERFFFSGDSGYDIHFAEIGRRYGPFDIAFIESGQYNPIWFMSHMFPKESVQAGLDLQARKMQPIHWGMFKLAMHDWYEPAEETLRIGNQLGLTVITPIIGEPVSPSSNQQFSAWWRD